MAWYSALYIFNIYLAYKNTLLKKRHLWTWRGTTQHLWIQYSSRYYGHENENRDPVEPERDWEKEYVRTSSNKQQREKE